MMCRYPRFMVLRRMKGNSNFVQKRTGLGKTEAWLTRLKLYPAGCFPPKPPARPFSHRPIIAGTAVSGKSTMVTAGGNDRNSCAPAPGSPSRAVFARWGGGSPASACFFKEDAFAQARVPVPQELRDYPHSELL